MIVAIDNYGDKYLCLSQSNTNQYSFCEFIRHLVRKLDRDRPKWRKNTIFQLDGATYHQTPLVKELLQKLRITALISGPYSFDGAAAELYFAMFKRDDLNL